MRIAILKQKAKVHVYSIALLIYQTSCLELTVMIHVQFSGYLLILMLIILAAKIA